MRVLCVIPARIGSTRLPLKPIRRIAGIPLIRMVAQRALDLDVADRTVVATDDRRVMDAVAGLDLEVVLTEAGHETGTERVGEVAALPRYRGVEAIVNLQGDEPLVPREAVTGALAELGRYDIGTAAGPLEPDHAGDPHRVKVMVGPDGQAIRFARRVASPADYHHHIGVYAYSPGALRRWVEAPVAPEERTERLEQLRPLGLGLTIGVALVADAPPGGVDTEDDLRRVELALATLSSR